MCVCILVYLVPVCWCAGVPACWLLGAALNNQHTNTTYAPCRADRVRAMCYVGLTPDSVPCRPVGSYDRQCYLRRCGLRAAGCGLRAAGQYVSAGRRVQLIPRHCSFALRSNCSMRCECASGAAGAGRSVELSGKRAERLRRTAQRHTQGHWLAGAQRPERRARPTGQWARDLPEHCGTAALRTSDFAASEAGGRRHLRPPHLRTPHLLPPAVLPPGSWQVAGGSWLLVPGF